jgi:hypothetical protein
MVAAGNSFLVLGLAWAIYCNGVDGTETDNVYILWLYGRTHERY